MEHLRRGARLLLATTPSLLAALAVTGCEPCSFIGCSDVPHMAVSAQFLDTNSGYPVPDTKVSVIVVNPDGTRDSVAGMTDQKGYVQLSAATAGKARGELLVAPPELPPYRVPLPCGPSVVDGGSCALGTVVVNPRYTAKGELHYRPDWDRLGGGLLVTFHETHGPRLLKGG